MTNHFGSILKGTSVAFKKIFASLQRMFWGETTGRPHPLTLALSVAAIAISVVSLSQSRRAYELSTGIARAAVQVSSLKLVGKPEDAAWLRYDLTFVNFGQITARNIVTRSEFDISPIEFPIIDTLYEHDRVPYLPPKSSETIRFQANRRLSGVSDALVNNSKNKLLIFGITEYTDDVTDVRSRESWCFVYDPTDDEEKKTLELRRCSHQP
jgi:hypothetical protein